MGKTKTTTSSNHGREEDVCSCASSKSRIERPRLNAVLGFDSSTPSDRGRPPGDMVDSEETPVAHHGRWRDDRSSLFQGSMIYPPVEMGRIGKETNKSESLLRLSAFRANVVFYSLFLIVLVPVPNGVKIDEALSN